MKQTTIPYILLKSVEIQIELSTSKFKKIDQYRILREKLFESENK